MSNRRDRRKRINESRNTKPNATFNGHWEGTRYIPTEEEILWSKYRLQVLSKIGIIPAEITFDGPEPIYDKHKRLSRNRFSTNYKTREEFGEDRYKILEHLSNHIIVPEELLNKVAETVYELNIKADDLI